MAARKGLGKGIDAMISGDNTKTKQVVKEVVKEVDTIDINKIEPNNNQPRKNFNEDKIHELAESIKQHGLIEPLIVQKGKKGFYTIIAGERRWRAAREAGVKEIPVVVKDYSDQQVMEIALIENIQREDLNAIEEAMQLKEQTDGKVVVFTMGPPDAEKALRDAMALGCDESCLITDRAVAGGASIKESCCNY